jgi:hypothetical protein
MPAYCTASDVGVLLQLDFTDANAQPTESQVNTICSQITSEIDLYLKAEGISTQPTDSDILNMLKKYCSLGAACMVGRTYFGNVDAITGSQPDSYCVQYQDFLKSIGDKPEIFGAASGDETAVFDNQVTTGNKAESTIPVISDSFDY